MRVPAIELRLGGQDYVTDPATPEVDLTVTRSSAGAHFHLRSEAYIVGPCWRCTGPARLPVMIDTSEFSADGRSAEDPFDEDLDSSYVEDGALALGLWARDAFAEALPAMILCREECAGLCPGCGADRNVVTCDCVEESGDSRWDALREISERLDLRE